MVTGIILSRNSEIIIARAISCLRKFDEILVYDTGSIDRTLEIASMFGVRIVKAEFTEGYAKVRNDAAAAAKYDFVFHLDTDEVINSDVYDYLKHHSELDVDECIGFNRYNMYDLKNYIKEWYPDTQWRAYNRKVCWYEKNVHEELKRKNASEVLCNIPILHNMFYEKKRIELNHRFYCQMLNVECSKEQARKVAEGYLKKETKKLDLSERIPK